MKRELPALPAIALTAALLANVPATAMAGPAWQAAGTWVIRSGNHCVADLRFSHKSAQLQVTIEPNPTQPTNYLYFITDGDTEFGWTKADVAIGSKWKAEQAMHVMPSKLPHHIVYKWGLSDERLSELEASRRIQVASEDLRVDLSLPDLASARAQLRTCDASLLERWGFGAERQARVARFPKLESIKLKESDYPASAYNRGSIGDVNGYLMVDAEGKASDCHVLDSSGWPELDSQTCQLLLQRPQYKPATDKAGNAMTAPYYFQWVWH